MSLVLRKTSFFFELCPLCFLGGPTGDPEGEDARGEVGEARGAGGSGGEEERVRVRGS